ncbi:hypothetical protein NDU88_001291 [Pleurodeles waltl]|uniref:Uncharacterized protein n=1 Tax=Pleurodeles waltl TaxID=8319 RepID=A0AAV7PAS0_PLEWA|nr:hypothetical protein NDU88_001291 [Pleurodeles waltl]
MMRTKLQQEGKSSLPNPEKMQDPLQRCWERVNRRRRDEVNNRSRIQEMRGPGTLSRHVPGGTWLHKVRRYFKEGRAFRKKVRGGRERK